MQKKFDYEKITLKACNCLKKELLYQYCTIRHYRSRWRPVKTYMDDRELTHISPSICKSFLLDLYQGRTHIELTANEKLIEKAVLVLSEFMETGAVQRKGKFRYLDGSIGSLIKGYLTYKQSWRIKEITLNKIESHFSNLNFWLSVNGIVDIHNIKHHHLIGYIKSLDSRKKALIHDTLMDLRGFFRFLYDNGVIQTDFSDFIPKDNYRNQARLPSYYSENEIAQLLEAADRGTMVGKRDYAILSLAAYLGLRVSDIARLKFENLHWAQQTITLTQFKTGKEIHLPLIPTVGNALLDYIQYGRPESEEPYIFLLAISPFLPVKGQTISAIVNRQFINAGFLSNKKRRGGHALRHSLVKELLNNKQSLPVISEVLGHKSTASTRHYIRIDEEALRQCALDVPIVNPAFYAQQGGGLFL